MTSLPASTAGNQEKETFQFPEVRVVEASAGSGKTYALAKRYIQLLLSAPDPAAEAAVRAILAITFTNKAALEMKERILAFLKAIAFKRLPESDAREILQPLGLDVAEASRRAFALMEAIIRHYNFFQVQTIDKFINALLSGCAFKVGLTARFRIKTNSREYLEYSLDEMVDRASRDEEVRRIFDHFLHNYLYLENRSGWFPKKDMCEILAALFTQNNFYGGDFREGPFTPEDLVRKKKAVLADIKDLRGRLPAGTDQRFVKSLEGFLADHPQGFDIDAVSNYFAREAVPARKGVAVPADVERLWTRINRRLREICEEEAYGLFNPYIRVFHVLRDILDDVAARDDVIFLEELNRKAGRLFSEDHVTVAELYYRLAGRFRHYLIDEFQDTSRLQWRNLEKMAEEALSTGGSLFYVGDRKQAIYGFRGGEAGLFDDVRAQFDAFGVHVDYLARNWRSQKAIVEFNNAVFSPENLKRFVLRKEEYEREKKKGNGVEFTPEDIGQVNYLFQGSRQSFEPGKNGGYVRVEAIPVGKKEERDEATRAKVTGLLRELRGRFACRDIAVLTRNNTQVEQVTRWLLEEGLQVESERTSDVTHNRVVQELVAFLRFLDSPVDNLAFSAFILGDIVPKATGLAPQALHEFVLGLRERLDREKDGYVYVEFRERFPGIWQKYFDEFFRNVGLYPLYELVVSLCGRFGLVSLFPEHQGFLMHFLELIKKREEEHSDITSFLDYFDHIPPEDLYVRVVKSDAVTVLTVHKAKGLEFPVVILPFLGMDVQVGNHSEGSAQPYVLRRSQGGPALELLRLKGKYFQFSDELYQIHAQEYKKAFMTELNNIYVALTRARDELYAFVPERVGNAFNLAQLLVPEELRTAGTPVAVSSKPASKPVLMELPAARYQDWIGYLKDEFAGMDDVRHREKRLRGEVIHFMLSLIGNLDQTDAKTALDGARRQSGYHFPSLEDGAGHLAVVEQLINNPPVKPFFYCGRSQVFTEKEIVDTRGHLKRLDRLIVAEKEVRIVDFKSSRDPEGKYADQVRGYMAIVGRMYPGKTVEGWLVYLDSVDVEKVTSNW